MRTSRVGGVLVALIAGLPAAAWAAQGGEGTTPLFTVNLGTTVWTAIVFLALLGILWRFAWGPILSAIESRESGIQSAIDEAMARNAEAERLLAEHRAQLADARRQASEIITEGKCGGRAASEGDRGEGPARGSSAHRASPRGDRAGAGCGLGRAAP